VSPRTPAAGRPVAVDCFGALLTRAVGSGDSVAGVTARLLEGPGAPVVEPAVLAEVRARAEALARGRRGERCTLTDVALQAADLLGAGPGAAAALEEAEVRAEQLLSRTVPAAVHQLAAVRAAGHPVVLWCRTLLPRPAVEELLDRHGLRQEGDVVVLSSDPDSAVPRPDPAWPLLGGAAAPETGLSRYEAVLDAARTASGGLAPAMAGAARRARLVLAAEPQPLAPPFVDVVAGVAGPLLAGYVLWCLQRAQEAGCRRVYFVSRDGEVLLRIARRLVGALGLDLDLRYLEGNRRAWLLPGMSGVDVERVAAVAGRGEVNTPRSLLTWVHLAPEDLAGPLTRAGFPAGSWDAAVAAGRVADVLGALEDPEAVPVVEEASRRATEDAGRYLSQIGLLDAGSYAIVDMEGHGNVGRLLAPLADKLGGRPPALELYFALVSPAPAPGRLPLGWMYDDARGTGVAEREGDVYVALEVFTAGSHGQVQGYETVGGTARAVLAEERNEAALAWGLGDLRRVLDVFADELATALPLVDVRGDVRGPAWEVLRTFWSTPTPAEVAAWGTFPFPGDEGHYPIARGFSTREVLRSAAQRRPRMRRRGTWPAGVRANAPVHLRLLQAALEGGRRAAAGWRA